MWLCLMSLFLLAMRHNQKIVPKSRHTSAMDPANTHMAHEWWKENVQNKTKNTKQPAGWTMYALLFKFIRLLPLTMTLSIRIVTHIYRPLFRFIRWFTHTKTEHSKKLFIHTQWYIDLFFVLLFIKWNDIKSENFEKSLPKWSVRVPFAWHLNT